MLLSGCGGGSDGAAGPGAATAIETADPPQLPLTAAAAVDDTRDAVTAAHFARLNEVRQAAGLPPARWNGPLAGAAQAHADYLVLNEAFQHAESLGAPGFTGADSTQRIAAAGFSGLAQEVMIGGAARSAAEGRARMDALLMAPQHRMQLMAVEYDQVGVGAARSGGPIVTDLAQSGGWRPAGRKALLFPFEGQSGVATYFLPGSEAGLPAGLPFMTGPPLTLSAGLVSMITYSDVRLFEQQSGDEVALIPISPPSDTRSALVFFPAQPLKPATSYVWTIAASVDKVASQMRARFTTG